MARTPKTDIGGLPAGGKTQWPPPHMAATFNRFQIFEAWYRGDPEVLAAVYGGAVNGIGAGMSENRFSLPWFRPPQVRSAGSATRAWWGKVPAEGDYPYKLHVPAAEDIAVVSAGLMFSEPPEVEWEDEATRERMDEVLERSNFHAKLLQAGEVQAVYGGVYMVITWDDQIAGHPWIRPVQADCAIPEFQWDVLVACTFFQTVHEDGPVVWRHLERHEKGRILHALYKGTRDELGWPIPLTEHPATERLTPIIETVPDRLTVEYVPSLLPNRLDPRSQQGRSDYSPGLITLMDALDQTYTSLMNDVELGEAKLVVPRSYLKSNGAGQGMRFDHSQRIYSPIEALDSPERPMSIEQVQFNIRVDEHLRICDDLYSRIVRSAGYSTQSVMGDDAAAPATATEVNVRKGKSDSTRDTKGLYWRNRMPNLLETLTLLDADKFKSGITPERPKFTFGDGPQEAPLTLAQTVQTLQAAQSASLVTRVRMAHPAWTKDQVDEEVAAIKGEQEEAMAAAMPPMPGGGMPGAPGGKPGVPGKPQGMPAGNPSTNPKGTPAAKPAFGKPVGPKGFGK